MNATLREVPATEGMLNPDASVPGGRCSSVTRAGAVPRADAAAGVLDLPFVATPGTVVRVAESSLIESLRLHHGQRQRWMRAANALRNAIRSGECSVCRVKTGDEARKILAVDLELAARSEALTEPLRYALEPIEAAMAALEKVMAKEATGLPVWPWVASVRGAGAFGLAQIVGECGDLGNYANPAKVWKRMGVAVLPDGTRQRLIGGTSLEQALAIGYVPRRRSVVHVIGDSLMKGNREGPYRTYYLAEKERQREKVPDAKPALAHNRALRHMEKRYLRDLWRAWRVADGMDPGRAWGEEAAQ